MNEITRIALEVAAKIFQFETSQGSVYRYGSDGRVLRQKSELGSTMEATSSSFDRTAFLSPEDLKSARLGLQRGLKPTDSGQFRGLDYDDSRLNSKQFMDLRFKQKMSFDEAYQRSGGKVSERLITPEFEPRLGYHPLEYNLGDTKFHAGNEVTRITTRDGRLIEKSFGSTKRGAEMHKASEKTIDAPKKTEDSQGLIGSFDVDDKKTKTVADAVKTEEKKPVIKVGEVVESKGEKVKKDISPKVEGKDVEKMANEDSASKPKTIKDEIIDAAISSGTKKTEKDEEGKDVDEKVADKIKEKVEEKLDPVSKIENLIENKKDEAIEELKDSVFKADDEAFARELAEKEGRSAATKASIGSSDLDDSIKPTKATPAPVSPTPKGMDAAVDPGTKGTAASRRIVDAGGRTAADTPAARAVLAADSAADGSLFSMTPKAAAKTVGEDIMSMAKNLVKGHKNAKNLRLAATAALLSSAGYGLGKARNRMGAKQNEEVSPDESEMLRRSLLEDG